MKEEKGIMLITLILMIILLIILIVVIYQVPELYFLRPGVIWPIAIGMAIQLSLMKKLTILKKVLIFILINTINIALPFILYNHAELIRPIIDTNGFMDFSGLERVLFTMILIYANTLILSPIFISLIKFLNKKNAYKISYILLTIIYLVATYLLELNILIQAN